MAKDLVLTLRRITFTPVSTMGVLSRDGVKLCDTLEDMDRRLEERGADAKVFGKTAIPRGKYELGISFSNRFKKYMMELKGVPYFAGIRLHAGNTHMNTEGCPLLGDRLDDNTLVNSRVRTEEVFEWAEEAIKLSKVYVEIV